MTTTIKTLIRSDEYLVKIAKPHVHSCRVAVPVEYLDKEVIIVPFVDDCMIRELDNGTYNIIVTSYNVMLKKVKKNNTTGAVYVPKEFVGVKLLIVPAPDY